MDVFLTIFFICLLIAAVLFGYFGGFGKVLIFASKGVVGKIVSIIICYSIFGFVLNFSFVQRWLNQFVNYLKTDPNFLKNLLLWSRIELIAFAVGLYFLIRLLLGILVHFVDDAMNSDEKWMFFANKFLGVVFSVAVVVIFMLIFLQLFYWFSGPSGAIAASLRDTLLLDALYLENPLHAIIKSFIR